MKMIVIVLMPSVFERICNLIMGIWIIIAPDFLLFFKDIIYLLQLFNYESMQYI